MEQSISKRHIDLDEVVKKIVKYMPNFDKKIFQKAFSFAEKAHRGQIRKDGITPYIVHPLRTVEILTNLCADQDTLISALLHDVPEDTEHDISEIEELFGKDVAFLVEGVTKLSKVHYQRDMQGRDIESLKKLFIHTAKDPRVIIIKLADRLHNMRTLDFVKPEKRVRIARETLSIYVPVANLLGIQEIKRELEELCFQYLFPSEFDELSKKFESQASRSRKSCESFIESVVKALKKNSICAKVFARKQKLYNVYKKLSSSGKSFDDIDDRIRISVIVSSITDCYQALGVIHSQFIPKTDRFRDYIANPKVNGYRSLHTVVFGIDGVLTEVHISTEKMHLESEYGIAAHFFEKENKEQPMRNEELADDKRSSWVSKILEIDKSEESDDYLENLKSDVLQDRIFVFTPKGSTIDLPKGASSIDFAYAIHSEVGRHAVKAKVNGILVPITTALKTGDVVKILTYKESSPELYWLNFAKTHFAKNKIKNYFKKVSREKKIEAGKAILQKEFDIDGLGLLGDFSFKKMRSALLKHHGNSFTNWDELFIAIGSGELKASSVVYALAKSQRKTKKRRKFFGLFSSDSDDGVKVGIKIIAKDRFGLMQDIISIVYKYSLDMTYFKGYSSGLLNYAYFNAQVIVENQESIGKLFDELEQIDDLKYVNRIIYRGLYLFYTVMLLTAVVWLMHPYILSRLLESSYFKTHALLSNVFFYGGFFLLLIMVLILTNLARKYFPIIRNQKKLRVLSFSVLTVAIAVLFIELMYLNINISWVFLLFGILAIYLYLGFNFRKTKY